MELTGPVLEGRFLRRYKRFFADVELADGSVVTAHCPNTGSLLGCLVDGAPVRLVDSQNAKRKLRYTWQAIEVEGTWVNVDTGIPNAVVHEAVVAGRLPALRGYDAARREVKYGTNSRIDLLLERESGERCYVEVKNTTLARGRTALFPDAVTERGRKHLDELAGVDRQGHRAVQFFFVSRADVGRFRPAEDIDPAYAEALARAVDAGVEVLAYAARVEPTQVELGRKLRLALPTG